MCGATYLVAPQITVPIFLRMLVRYRPTIMGVAGPLLDRFQSLGISKKVRFTPRGLIGAYTLRHLRGVISMNSAAQAEAALHVTGLHIYGMTEGLLMFTRESDPDEVRTSCVGQPVSRDEASWPCLEKVKRT
ncbi:MAG: AMP-binding protein [Chloroflexota bacterium]